MDNSLPLPLVMAGLDRVDQLRDLSALMPKRIDQGQALAQRLQEVYAHQDIPVSLELIQQAAQDVVGEVPTLSFSNAPAWKNLSPHTAAELLSKQQIWGCGGDGYGFRDPFSVAFIAGVRRRADQVVEDEFLLNVFGAKAKLSSTELQRGLYANRPKRLAHWVPYDPVTDTPGHMLIDARSRRVRSYLISLLLWKLLRNGWSSPQEITETCFYESHGNPDNIDWEAEAFALDLLLPLDRVSTWRVAKMPRWFKSYTRSTEDIASVTQTPVSMVAFRAQQLGWKS